jgi:hypothetical protein
MRIVNYAIIAIVILILYMINRIIKNENFPQETVDAGNNLVKNTNLSLSDFMKNYDNIAKITNKSTFIQNTYNKERDILLKYDSNLKPLIDKTKTLVNCTDGNYVNSLSGKCEICKAGGSCTDGKFTQCRGNTYQENTSSTECKLCPKGSSSYGYGGTKCVACKQGTWINVLSSNAESKKCQSCVRGMINEGEGNTSCVNCPKNYYCVQDKYTKEEDINESLASFKYICPSGSYTEKTGSRSLSECLKCPDGKINTGCTDDCPVGFYCNNTYNTDGLISQNIYKCPEGTYNNKAGSSDISACLKCPVGTYSTQASEECKKLSDCPPGYYIEGDKWIICPEGFYCVNGVKNMCQNGKWSEKGYSDCFECPSDSMCRNGVKKLRTIPEKIENCLDGYYFDSATSTCVLCTSEFSCAKGLKTACKKTNGNAEYYDLNSNTCKICPAGSKCENGILTICPDGMYTDNQDGVALKGQISCTTCPVGVTCIKGVKKVCPPGQTTLAPGATLCRTCSNGYYRDENVIPTVNNKSGYCRSTDGTLSDKNKCDKSKGIICPIDTAKDSTVKSQCGDGKYAGKSPIDGVTDSCVTCEANNYCVGGVKNKCPVALDAYGNEFDLVSNPGATKCSYPNNYMCPTNSGDCLSGCCGKQYWYDTYNYCLDKGKAAYGCL